MKAITLGLLLGISFGYFLEWFFFFKMSLAGPGPGFFISPLLLCLALFIALWQLKRNSKSISYFVIAFSISSCLSALSFVAIEMLVDKPL